MSIRVFDYFVLTLLYVISTLLEKRMRFVSCLIYFPLYSCLCYSTIMLINFLERHPLTPFICMLHVSHDKRPPDTSDTLDFGLGYPVVVIVVVRWRMKWNGGGGGVNTGMGTWSFCPLLLASVSFVCSKARLMNVIYCSEMAFVTLLNG